MARISGIDIPNDKILVVSLQYIYGIGLTRAQQICKGAGISETKRVKDCTEPELTKIREQVAKFKTEGDLRREVALNIKRLQDIGSYRGIRHRKGLPCRGQRTKTNARTCKGPKKTVANKKKATA